MTAPWRGWWSVLACLAIALGPGCDSLPGRPKLSDQPVAPQEIKEFAPLYADNCAGCHGADGAFGAATPMNNATYLSLVDDASLRRAIERGVAGTSMPPFASSEGGSLTDEQIGILIAGMRRRWAHPSASIASAPTYASSGTGDSERGAAVYSVYCESCHGPGGNGGERAGSIADSSYLSLTSDQSIRTLIIAGRPDFGHPDWRGYATHQPLSSQQVSDLVAWLAAKRPSPFRQQPQTASTR